MKTSAHTHTHSPSIQHLQHQKHWCTNIKPCPFTTLNRSDVCLLICSWFSFGFFSIFIVSFFFSMELYSLNTHKQREYLLYICQQNVVFTFQNHWTILFNVAPTKNNRTDFSVDGGAVCGRPK